MDSVRSSATRESELLLLTKIASGIINFCTLNQHRLGSEFVRQRPKIRRPIPSAIVRAFCKTVSRLESMTLFREELDVLFAF
jgi:hypothetical protein